MTSVDTAEATGATASDGARRRMRQVGRVSSVAGTKSVVVQVDRRVGHERYGKYVSKRSKFMAHDERSECSPGDVVEIVACRPLSARKRWRVRSVVERAVLPGAEAEA